VDVSNFTFNKLVQVQMVSGTFVVGETVSGDMPSTNNTENVTELIIPSISFRVQIISTAHTIIHLILM
jgi:hypothetical protein